MNTNFKRKIKPWICYRVAQDRTIHSWVPSRFRMPFCWNVESALWRWSWSLHCWGHQHHQRHRRSMNTMNPNWPNETTTTIIINKWINNTSQCIINMKISLTSWFSLSSLRWVFNRRGGTTGRTTGDAEDVRSWTRWTDDDVKSWMETERSVIGCCWGNK